MAGLVFEKSIPSGNRRMAGEPVLELPPTWQLLAAPRSPRRSRRIARCWRAATACASKTSCRVRSCTGWGHERCGCGNTRTPHRMAGAAGSPRVRAPGGCGRIRGALPNVAYSLAESIPRTKAHQLVATPTATCAPVRRLPASLEARLNSALRVDQLVDVERSGARYVPVDTRCDQRTTAPFYP